MLPTADDRFGKVAACIQILRYSPSPRLVSSLLYGVQCDPIVAASLIPSSLSSSLLCGKTWAPWARIGLGASSCSRPRRGGGPEGRHPRQRHVLCIDNANAHPAGRPGGREGGRVGASAARSRMLPSLPVVGCSCCEAASAIRRERRAL